MKIPIGKEAEGNWATLKNPNDIVPQQRNRESLSS